MGYASVSISRPTGALPHGYPGASVHIQPCLSHADQEMTPIKATRCLWPTLIPHTNPNLLFMVPAPRCALTQPQGSPRLHSQTHTHLPTLAAMGSSPPCFLSCRLSWHGLNPWGWSSHRSIQTLRMLSGDLGQLPTRVRDFVERSARLCQPEGIHVCDGTEAENTAILALLEQQGLIRKLSKYDNW